MQPSNPIADGNAKIAAMNPSQRAKFDGVCAELKVRWAVAHGDLPDIVVDALVARAAVDADIGARVAGAEPFDTIEQTAARLARDEEFVQRAVESRDAALRAELEQEARDAIPAQMRMSMERAGTLKPHLDKTVAEMLDARASRRFQ